MTPDRTVIFPGVKESSFYREIVDDVVVMLITMDLTALELVVDYIIYLVGVIFN